MCGWIDVKVAVVSECSHSNHECSECCTESEPPPEQGSHLAVPVTPPLSRPDLCGLGDYNQSKVDTHTTHQRLRKARSAAPSISVSASYG
uniref:Uncharacterized protein n=1 Tax=Knipowitschia caucasica TaxID=637954 RepID=A0AAV2KPB6_KNICA